MSRPAVLLTSDRVEPVEPPAGGAMTLDEAAAFLRLDRRIVSELFTAGRIEGVRLKRRIRLYRPSVVAFLRGKGAATGGTDGCAT